VLRIARAPWPQEKTGARYLWMTAADATAQTVTFRGQFDPTATQMVTMTWDELRIDQP
jgi:hypothetical protein